MSGETRDQLKPFGKQLFATFLGLLMALGLESWHDDYRQKKTADQAIQSIREELQGNLAELDAVRKVGMERSKTIGEERKMLASLVKSLGSRDTPPLDLNLDIGFTFPDLHAAAWRSAGTTLLLHRLSFDRIQRIDQAYLIHDAISGWVTQVSNPLLQATVDIMEEAKSLKMPDGRLDPKQLAALDRSLHWLQTLQDNIVDFANQAIEREKAALEAVSQ